MSPIPVLMSPIQIKIKEKKKNINKSMIDWVWTDGRDDCHAPIRKQGNILKVQITAGQHIVLWKLRDEQTIVTGLHII